MLCPATAEGDELTELLERLRSRPEYRMLFKLADGATAEDVRRAVSIIQALRDTDSLLSGASRSYIPFGHRFSNDLPFCCPDDIPLGTSAYTDCMGKGCVGAK